MPGIDALRNDRAGHQRAVGVVGLDPVVVGDADLPGVGFADPDTRPAAAQCQHQQVVGVGAVDAPFLMRRDEVQHDFRVAVAVRGPGMCPVALVSTGGRQVTRPSPKARIHR